MRAIKDSLTSNILELRVENRLLKEQIIEFKNVRTDPILERNGYAVLFSGTLITIILLIVMNIRGKFFGPNFTKVLGITILLTFLVFLTVVSNSLDKLTPVVGLIGTLAGYLFGKSEKDDLKNNPNSQPQRKKNGN